MSDIESNKISEILSLATPGQINEIIQDYAGNDEDLKLKLWEQYILKTYGIDCSSDMFNKLLAMGSYCDICDQLQENLDAYIEVGQVPSSNLLLKNTLDFFETGELPNICDTEDEMCLIDFMAPEVEVPLPEKPLSPADSKNFFRKYLYVPRTYVFSIGPQNFNFDLSALNYIMCEPNKFDKDLLNIEMDRRYELTRFNDDGSSSD